MKKDVHIGKLIKLKLSESNLSIADFAEAIHKTRTTVYDIFNRKSIDIDLLVTISEVLQFDFISYAYSNGLKHPLPAHPIAISSLKW